MLRIGGTPLPLHLPLEPPNLLLVGTQLRAQRHELRLRLLGHDGEAGGSQVQADGVRACGVLRLAMGDSFQRQLHVVAVSLAVCPLGAFTAGTALHQASIFNAVPEPVCDHLILPINHSRHPVMLPDQPALVALLWLLQHKAQPGIVALVLDTTEASATTAEAHPFGLSHTDAVE